MKCRLQLKRPFGPIHIFLRALLFRTGCSPAHGQNRERTLSRATTYYTAPSGSETLPPNGIAKLRRSAFMKPAYSNQELVFHAA